MQTIGVLVAEKQDLQQKISHIDPKLEQLTNQNATNMAEIQSLNKKCVMLQRDLTSQTEENTALEKVESNPISYFKGVLYTQNG